MKNIVQKNISEQQKKDTGLALTLLLLIIGLITNNPIFFKLTIPFILVTMLIPNVLYPLAIIWFTLSHILGFIVSKIVISIIYFLFIVPFGFVRGLLGKDTLRLKQFKTSKDSVFVSKNHKFVKQDLLKPF